MQSSRGGLGPPPSPSQYSTLRPGGVPIRQCFVWAFASVFTRTASGNVRAPASRHELELMTNSAIPKESTVTDAGSYSTQLRSGMSASAPRVRTMTSTTIAMTTTAAIAITHEYLRHHGTGLGGG